MCPREGVLLSLGVDVYVRGNPTWMGLCVHACIPVFVAECVYELKCVNVHRVTCVFLFFSFGLFLCADVRLTWRCIADREHL